MEEKLVIQKKSLKGEDGYKVFSVRVKNEIVESLEKLSAQTNRSRNELVNTLLEYAIQHCTITN